jgi:hypothetical protein
MKYYDYVTSIATHYHSISQQHKIKFTFKLFLNNYFELKFLQPCIIPHLHFNPKQILSATIFKSTTSGCDPPPPPRPPPHLLKKGLTQGTLTEGGLSTIDLLIKVACFTIKLIMFAISKAADQN